MAVRNAHLQRGDELDGELMTVGYIHECQNDIASCGVWILMVILIVITKHYTLFYYHKIAM